MLLDYDNLVKKYKMNVTGVIHIGGHHGSEYDIYNQYDSIQHMLFFEPDEDSYKVLVNKVGDDDRAICINKALGPFKGKTSFFRSKNHGQSKRRKFRNHLHKGCRYHRRHGLLWWWSTS